MHGPESPGLRALGALPIITGGGTPGQAAPAGPRHRGGFPREMCHMFPAVKPLQLFTLGALAMLLASCAKDTRHAMRISVAEQKMAVYDRGVEIARFDVSTS